MIPYSIVLVILVPFLFLPTNNNKINKYILIIWTSVAVILYMLHGNFTADFQAYNDFFHEYSLYNWENISSILTIRYHFNVLEIGYVLLNFIVSRFTSNYMFMQLVQSLIICIPVALYVKKSKNIVLSLVMYLAIGTYLESFNTVRGLMAASIYTLSFQYVENGDIKKYLLITFLASLLHLSAILMIPFYWILRFKPTIKSTFIYSMVTLFCMAFIENIAYIYNLVFKVADGNVLSLLYRNSVGIKSIAVFVLFSISSIILFIINKKNAWKGNKDYLITIEERCLYNGTLIWTLLKFMTLVTGYSTRFAAYFSVFVLVFFPYTLNMYLSEKKQKLISIMLFVFCSIYFFMQTTGYGNYFTLL